MLSDVGDISSEQGDGRPPAIMTAGAAPGESGIQVAAVNFTGGAHFIANLRQHVIVFDSRGPIACRLGGQSHSHDAPDGSLAILPAGLDGTADRDGDARSLLVAVAPSAFSLAAAEDSATDAELPIRLAGYDSGLLHLTRLLVAECANGFPRGALFWNETASRFMAALIERHALGAKPGGGVVDAAMLRRLRDYLMAHLDEPIDVAALARMTGRSQFHFSRVFRRAVGVSPYRYIVHLRLRRAVELVREGRMRFAEIAAATGFADQSHLSRWVKRVHGVSLTQLSA
jgi:AraC family transcriptional regulator